MLLFVKAFTKHSKSKVICIRKILDLYVRISIYTHIGGGFFLERVLTSVVGICIISLPLVVLTLLGQHYMNYLMMNS